MMKDPTLQQPISSPEDAPVQEGLSEIGKLIDLEARFKLVLEGLKDYDPDNPKALFDWETDETIDLRTPEGQELASKKLRMDREQNIEYNKNAAEALETFLELKLTTMKDILSILEEAKQLPPGEREETLAMCKKVLLEEIDSLIDEPWVQQALVFVQKMSNSMLKVRETLI